jgi:NTP pyrophosphatase (non-canonical NTP hydrolase)
MPVVINGWEYEDGSFQAMLDAYQGFVLRGVSLKDDTPRERLLLAMAGLAGETGEVVDLLKKYLFHGNEAGLNDKLIKEMGDVLWYYSLLLHVTGISLDEVVAANVEKLTARYPEKHNV